MKVSGIRADVLALLLATVTATGSAPAVQTPVPRAEALPTARACALEDFGTPLPTNALVTPEPTLFQEMGRIAEWTDGSLYSTGPQGGLHGLGAVFRMTPEGTLDILGPFDGANATGAEPRSGLVDGGDGYLYGATRQGGTFKTGTLFRVSPVTRKAEKLYSFRNGFTIGLVPPCSDRRCALSPEQIRDAAPGYPSAPPVPDGRGNFYGVTAWTRNQVGGVLYKLSPPYDSTGFQVLCIFSPRLIPDPVVGRFVCGPKGEAPSMVILGRDKATLFGVLSNGNGHVFGATLEGKVSILHDFDLTRGSKPYDIMQASDDALYGTTYNGGATGGGVLYRLGSSGSGFRVMSSFRIGPWIAGLNPISAPVEGKKPGGGSDGFLYGVTRYGGRKGRGALYKIPLDGDSLGLTVLHDFDGGNGRSPIGAPVFHSNGNLYGLTNLGGTHERGAFYRLSHPEYPDRKTRQVAMRGGVVAKDDNGKLLVDPMVQVMTGVEAWQGAYDAKTSLKNGIAIEARCRNPHFVQLVYRTRMSPGGTYFPGTISTRSGSYPLTVLPGPIQWHTDAVGKPDAYFEHGPGAGWQITTGGGLRIWDLPTFGPPVYDMAFQTGGPSEVWSLVARTFLICNCGVQREIQWTTQMKNGIQTYRGIQILPATNAVLPDINARLKLDGYDSIP